MKLKITPKVWYKGELVVVKKIYELASLGEEVVLEHRRLVDQEVEGLFEKAHAEWLAKPKVLRWLFEEPRLGTSRIENLHLPWAFHKYPTKDLQGDLDAFRRIKKTIELSNFLVQPRCTNPNDEFSLSFTEKEISCLDWVEKNLYNRDSLEQVTEDKSPC